jgi:hypothetical protein
MTPLAKPKLLKMYIGSMLIYPRNICSVSDTAHPREAGHDTQGYQIWKSKTKACEVSEGWGGGGVSKLGSHVKSSSSSTISELILSSDGD